MMKILFLIKGILSDLSLVVLSVSLDDVTENWSEMSRKGETFEPFLLFILILGGGGGAR